MNTNSVAVAVPVAPVAKPDRDRRSISPVIGLSYVRNIPTLGHRTGSTSPPFNSLLSRPLKGVGWQEQEQESVHRDSDCREARVEA